MKIPKLIKIEKFLNFLKKLPRMLAKKAFLVFLGLTILALIVGAFLFFKYTLLIKESKPKFIDKVFKFEEKTYQDILKILEERNKRFEGTNLKEYPDLFRVD
jgi:hypothetical protein